MPWSSRAILKRVITLILLLFKIHIFRNSESLVPLASTIRYSFVCRCVFGFNLIQCWMLIVMHEAFIQSICICCHLLWIGASTESLLLLLLFSFSNINIDKHTLKLIISPLKAPQTHWKLCYIQKIPHIKTSCVSWNKQIQTWRLFILLQKAKSKKKKRSWVILWM